MMKDYRTHLETLRQQAAESTLISSLATAPQKRALLATIAVHLNTLAAKVERAMAAADGKVSGTASGSTCPDRGPRLGDHRTNSREMPEGPSG